MKKNQNRKKFLANFGLIGGMFLLGLIVLGIAFLMGRGGKTVVVRVDGKVVGEYALSQNRTVQIDGIDGQNILIIEDGQAKMQDADCPDKLCVHQGDIRMNGQSIICLPHKVVAEITDITSSADTDADIIVK